MKKKNSPLNKGTMERKYFFILYFILLTIWAMLVLTFIT